MCYIRIIYIYIYIEREREKREGYKVLRGGSAVDDVGLRRQSLGKKEMLGADF